MYTVSQRQSWDENPQKVPRTDPCLISAASVNPTSWESCTSFSSQPPNTALAMNASDTWERSSLSICWFGGAQAAFSRSGHVPGLVSWRLVPLPLPDAVREGASWVFWSKYFLQVERKERDICAQRSNVYTPGRRYWPRPLGHRVQKGTAIKGWPWCLTDMASFGPHSQCA